MTDEKINRGSSLLVVTGENVDQDMRIVSQIVHRTRGDQAEYAVRIPWDD